MKSSRRSIAALELLLIFPSVLFMTALFVRNVQPLRYEPAHTAERIVDWYAARTHLGLWLFLIAFPLTVLLTGSIALSRGWRNDASLREATQSAFAALSHHAAELLVAAATLTATVILAIVALHLLSS